MNKPLVYICSPCRGNYEMNIDNAVSFSRAAFTRGYIPITPHLYFTRFMNDENSKERSMAMEAGLQLLLMCSEVWVFGLDHPSEGMQAEIALAIRHGIPIVDGDEILRGKKKTERRDAIDASVYCMQTIAETTTDQKTIPDGFVSFKELFERMPIRKEVKTCQRTETMKAIRILPHGKR